MELNDHDHIMIALIIKWEYNYTNPIHYEILKENNLVLVSGKGWTEEGRKYHNIIVD
jgi:hypothetical protein